MISLHYDNCSALMATEYKTENMVQLAFAVLLQAVRDYVRLRELGIVAGTEVREYRFYRKYNSATVPNHPLNYATAEQVKSLILFLSGKDLDYYCSLLRFPACRVRSAIGLTKGLVKRPLLTMKEITAVEQAQIGDMQHELWLAGGGK